MCLHRLLKEGLSPSYEPFKFVIINSFKLNNTTVYQPNTKKQLAQVKETIREITYTPDFYLKYKGYDIFIETKGMPNETYPLKKKLFLKYLEESGSNVLFFEPHNSVQITEVINIIKQL